MLDFEELDFRHTPMGELSLRRRSEPRLDDRVVYEVKLGEEFLMSSLFTVSEVALAELVLSGAAWPEMDVVVGGLGLGYTAAAALDFPAVRSLLVVDAMPAVIEWHERALVPNGERLGGDPRCRFLQADFFAALSGPRPCLDPDHPGRLFHAILLDIDHSPSHRLGPSSADFYTSEGLSRLASQLHPGGHFALWSNDAPEPAFQRVLDGVFAASGHRVVEFDNPYTGGSASSTIYLANTAG